MSDWMSEAQALAEEAEIRNQANTLIGETTGLLKFAAETRSGEVIYWLTELRRQADDPRP